MCSFSLVHFVTFILTHVVTLFKKMSTTANSAGMISKSDKWSNKYVESASLASLIQELTVYAGRNLAIGELAIGG